MGMGVPLKLAAANSGVILGVGSCVSIWPYIYAGGIIPFFVLPWLAGQVIGGFVGSYALARIKVHTVRLILIGIMVFTCFGLITKGLSLLGMMQSPSSTVQLILFAVIIACVIAATVFDKRRETEAPEKDIAGDESNNRTELSEKPVQKLPLSNKVYASMVHWITIVASLLALFVPILILINPANNVLNPNIVFKEIFSGASPSEIWANSSTGGFPGAHYYLSYLFKADSWAQFAINLGCSVGLWALIPTVVIQFFKEKKIFYAVLGTMLLTLIACAMLGVF
jgi:uncharacterized membrane protein YfcA